MTYTNTDCLSSKWGEYNIVWGEYNIVSNNSAERGICIYVHCSIKFSVVVDSLVASVLECLLVDVKLPYHNTYMCIAAFYRSLTVILSSLINNTNILACIFRIASRSSKFLILGDFNLPLID